MRRTGSALRALREGKAILNLSRCAFADKPSRRVRTNAEMAAWLDVAGCAMTKRRYRAIKMGIRPPDQPEALLETSTTIHGLYEHQVRSCGSMYMPGDPVYLVWPAVSRFVVVEGLWDGTRRIREYL
jgi:hypothetical protein